MKTRRRSLGEEARSASGKANGESDSRVRWQAEKDARTRVVYRTSELGEAED